MLESLGWAWILPSLWRKGSLLPLIWDSSLTQGPEDHGARRTFSSGVWPTRGEVSVYAPPCSTTHFRGLVVCHVEMEKGRENPDWGLVVEEQGALNCVGI